MPCSTFIRASTIVLCTSQRTTDMVRSLLFLEKTRSAQSHCLPWAQPAGTSRPWRRRGKQFLSHPGSHNLARAQGHQGSPAKARSTTPLQFWAPEQTSGSSTTPQQGSSLSTNDIVLIYVLHRLDESGSFLPNILPLSAEWSD